MRRWSRRDWVEGMASRLLLWLHACASLRALAAVVLVVLVSVVLLSARSLVWPPATLSSPPSRHVVRSLPLIQVASPAQGTFTTSDTIAVSGRMAEGELPACFSLRNGDWQSVLMRDGPFHQETPLREGENRIIMVGGDLAGISPELSVTVVRDTTAPEIDLALPPSDYVTREPRLEMRGRLEDCWPAALKIQGRDVPFDGQHAFARTVNLAEGENRIVLEGWDRIGNRSRKVVRVVLDQNAPVVTVTSPPEGLVTNATVVEVVCQVEEARPSRLLMNNRRVAVDGEGRCAARLTLVEGVNRCVIRGLDLTANRLGTVVCTVTCDTAAPTVQIASVQQEKGRTAGQVTVSGTVSEDGCRVTVWGQPAIVRSREFTATVSRTTSAPLVVVATDRAGNRSHVPWYPPATIGRLGRVVRDSGWGRPTRNSSGTLEVRHRLTGLVFVLVPAGSFRMGSNEGDRNELPLREVNLGAFLLSKTECTQAAWDRVKGTDDREWRGERLPIETVSWTAVKEWCSEAGLRLPSESEWEYACRAGSSGRWSFGNEESSLKDYAEYVANNNWQPSPVGGKKANGWGFFDMHGNIWEWCEDWFGGYEEAPQDGSARTKHGSASRRVRRGGCWLNSASGCRSAYRNSLAPHDRGRLLGFRPAVSLPQ